MSRAPATLDRRAFVALMGACATTACRNSKRNASSERTSTSASANEANSLRPRTPREGLDVLEWTFPNDASFAKRAVVLVPKPRGTASKLPLLIALHGMGETIDPDTGAHAWLNSYEIDATLFNLRTPPLTADAFKGFVKDDHLADLNASLAKQPFGGMVIACPYLPAGIGMEDAPFDAYVKWLADQLIPRLRRETPIVGTAKSTGIDGVSLGGINALRFGMMRPDVFGVVGALQPAVYDDVAMASMIAEKLGDRPLRIVTSEEDVYRETLTTMSASLRERKIAHEFAVTPGPHGYEWNKGAGAIEMLLWHDRVLRDPHL
ncbi:MAG: hypothetical protein NVS3B20_07600 [Polyangiales bacterium]